MGKGMGTIIGIKRLARFLRDRRGAAAVEFALIAPLLLTLYLVTQEVGQGIENNRKVARVAAMVGDLVTQQSNMTANELEAILKIGDAIMYPYGRSRPTIEVTAITISNDREPKAQVHWSGKIVNGSYMRGEPVGTLVTVPESINERNSFLIRVTASLDYRPMVTWTAEQKTTLGLMGGFDRIGMKETYHLSPRVTNQINCSTCRE